MKFRSKLWNIRDVAVDKGQIAQIVRKFKNSKNSVFSDKCPSRVGGVVHFCRLPWTYFGPAGQHCMVGAFSVDGLPGHGTEVWEWEFSSYGAAGACFQSNFWAEGVTQGCCRQMRVVHEAQKLHQKQAPRHITWVSPCFWASWQPVLHDPLKRQ